MLFASRSSAFSRSSSRLLSSPCGERLNKIELIYKTITFPSTLPVRGATIGDILTRLAALISIHAPRAGSDISFSFLLTGKIYFNPRSPCGERRVCRSLTAKRFTFQSTLPVRGATCDIQYLKLTAFISIHAPRAGSDLYCIYFSGYQPHFNPRSPCGERRRLSLLCNSRSKFQSTLPVRGATFAVHCFFYIGAISIHAPRAGSDDLRKTSIVCLVNFNPRSPCGERRLSL